MEDETSSFPQGNPLPDAELATSHVDQLLGPTASSGAAETELPNSNDLTPLARSTEDLSPARSAASTVTTAATDDEADRTQSGPASENGVQIGHGSDDGAPLDAVSPTKLVTGRRRSATGLEMPVLDQTTNSSNGPSAEAATLESPVDPESRLPTLHAVVAPNDVPLTNGDILPPLLPNASSTPTDTVTIPVPPKGSPKQKFTAAPPQTRLPDTPSSPPRPSTSREVPTLADSADSPRRRPATSTDVQRLSREKSTKEGEERKSDREKEKEKDNTRSRKVLGEWTMSKTLGAGSMGKVKLGISSITGEKVRLSLDFCVLRLMLFGTGRYQDHSSLHFDRGRVPTSPIVVKRAFDLSRRRRIRSFAA